MARHSNGGGRWDADRFLRESDVRKGSPRRERAPSVSVAERERDDRRRRVGVDDYLRPPETYQPLARQPDRDYDDAHLVGESNALVPFEERHRRPASPERPPAPTSARRAAPRQPQPQTQQPPTRPRLLKRQSSLDTFQRAADRRAQDNRRYGREDTRPSATRAAFRKRAPSQGARREAAMDEVGVAEPDYYGDERYRRVREPSAPPRGRRTSLREHIVDERVEQRSFPQPGKTRVPKRFVHPRAMIDLGYPYEDEGDSYVLFKALGKENIDELFAFSQAIKRESESRSRERSPDRVKVGTLESDIAFERRRSRSLSRGGAALTTAPRNRQHRRVYSPSPSTSSSRSPALRATNKHRARRLSSPMPPRNQAYQDVIKPRADMAMVLPDRRRGREIVRRERSRSRSSSSSPEPAVEEVRSDYKDPSPRMIRAMMTALT